MRYIFVHAGPITSMPFSNKIPDTLRSSLLQAVDEKNVLTIDKPACEILNLSPLVDLKNDHTPGIYSLFLILFVCFFCFVFPRY